MSDVKGRWKKFKVLLWVQFARLRTSWRPYLIVSSVMPLGIAILLRAVMNDEQVDEFGRQIVAGSVVLAIAMTAVVMGFGAPDEQLAGMYSNLAMMAVLFLGILPPESLPGWIEPLRVVLPSTYAINALQPGLEGVVSATQLWNLGVLAAFGTLSFWAVNGPLWPKGD